MYLLCYFRYYFKSNYTLPDRNAEYGLIRGRKVIVEEIHLRSLVEHTHCGDRGSDTGK